MKILELFKQFFEKPDTFPPRSYPSVRPYQTDPGLRRRRRIPDQINRFYIPLAVMKETDRVMRQFGREKRECYVWWGGYFTDHNEGQILTALWSEKPTEFGRVHLTNRDLTALHMKLSDLDQILLVELHTHPPGAGGQNSVDAAHPAATYPGFITIVVPDFADPHFYDLRKSYVYEYLQARNWRELDEGEITSKFVLEETKIIVTLENNGPKR